MSAPTLEKLAAFRSKIERERDKNPDRPVIDHLESEYAERRRALAEVLEVSPEEVDARVHEEIYGHRPGEEPPDDAIIGRAFRVSLAVMAVAAVLVAGAVYLLSRPAEAPPEQEIAASAPQEVRRTEVEPPQLAFTDITEAAGIDFVHANGASGEKLLPETMGGGVAFFDYDDDGDQDLLFVNATSWPWNDPGPGGRPTQALYANDGTGRFTEVTAQAGLDIALYGMGAAVADYDGDGDRDLFVTAVGENRLLENRDGRFVDVTGRARVGGAPEDWSTCATFLDHDRDGDLDLFVCNYVRWSKEIDYEVDYRLTGIGRAYGPPMNYQGAHSRLYRNDGNGTFTDISSAAGIEVDNPATGMPAGKALAVVPVDVDRDGWMDLLVANDTVGNFFFRNQGDGTFVEEGALMGVAYDQAGNATGAMGVDVGHYRNDEDIAFLIGNFANEMTSVYVAQGAPSLFTDEAIPAGIGAPSRTRLTFGLLLLDVDLDGRLDLLQTNGHLEEEIAQVDPSQQYRQSSQLFWNAGAQARETFVPLPPERTGDLATPLVGRGSATADIDGDGDLDVVMTQVGDRPLLLRNDQGTGHHWLRVVLEGEAANPDALGAWVTLTAGGASQHRPVMPTRSYLSQSELPVTFGLGETARIERLLVSWPDGAEQLVEPEAGAIDRTLVIRKGE